MKKKYILPEYDIEKFKTISIISTSTLDDGIDKDYGDEFDF